MPREAGVVLVVVLVLAAHEVYLAWSLARTRVRLLSLERFVRADRERLAVTGQAPALVTTPAPPPAAAQVSGVTELDDDDACTKVWTGAPAALVEGAARGANPSSQATPRAAVAMDVAPRAVGSPPPLSRAAQLAAGLERPKSTRTRRAPLADPDLIGSEDQADEAARHRLGADEPTPRQARAKVDA